MRSNSAHTSLSRQRLPRFVAIDGLRAWMAWLVVFSHILQLAFPRSELFGLYDIGGHAVDTFIIISGFVITHLIIQRPTSYISFLIPRFMRLFPAFCLSCIFGFLAYWSASAWAQPEWFNVVFEKEWESIKQFWPYHLFAHLFMIHGAIPNTLLPYSQYAFNPPGWSVSLEWQFYIVAPMVVWLCNAKSRSWITVAFVVMMALSYHFLFKGFWDRPSVLFGTSKFFIIGIASRYAIPYFTGAVSHAAAIGVGLLFTVLWIGSPSVAIWLAALSFVARDNCDGIGVDGIYRSTMTMLLESPLIIFLSDRSYSTYLLHWPILMIIGTMATRAGVSSGIDLAIWLMLVFPLTLALQEPVYKLVEIPARKLGKRWSSRVGLREPHTETA